MASINAINFTSKSSVKTPLISQEHKDKSEQVAAGVGGAAGLSTTATKFASKQGLRAQSAEKALQQGMETVTNANRAIQKNKKAVTGLWGSFKNNIGKFSNDIARRLDNFKNSKFIGPLIKSPVTKALSKFLGGALAFFVLTTGVVKACRTGAIAFDDFKNQYNEMRG